MKRISLFLIGVLALVGLLAAAGISASKGGGATPEPPGPAGFVARVDNPWFPLRPGSIDVYNGVKEGERSRDIFTVTGETKLIEGVRCTAVSDRLYLKGQLEERTTDWYAQDKAGNVWYFGEATAELHPNGSVKSTEGSWQAGVDGARAGIFMPAHPHPRQHGQQEFYKGHAQDHYRVLSLTARVQTPAASSSAALLTQEWTPLESGVIDHKLYVKGIGTVLEQTIKGGDERNTLVAIRHR